MQKKKSGYLTQPCVLSPFPNSISILLEYKFIIFYVQLWHTKIKWKKKIERGREILDAPMLQPPSSNYQNYSGLYQPSAMLIGPRQRHVKRTLIAKLLQSKDLHVNRAQRCQETSAVSPSLLSFWAKHMCICLPSFTGSLVHTAHDLQDQNTVAEHVGLSRGLPHPDQLWCQGSFNTYGWAVSKSVQVPLGT